MEFEYIYTNRLKLRKVTQEVLAYVFSTYDDAALMDFFGYRRQEELNSMRTKFQKGMETHNRKFLIFQIIPNDSDTPIGSCSFHSWLAEHSRSEIGYDIHHEEQKRKGYMSEALDAVIQYGFEHMGLNRIEAFVGPNNEASNKLVLSAGFIKEGHLRQHYCKNNQIEDSIVYGLLKQEYIPK